MLMVTLRYESMRGKVPPFIIKVDQSTLNLPLRIWNEQIYQSICPYLSPFVKSSFFTFEDMQGNEIPSHFPLFMFVSLTEPWTYLHYFIDKRRIMETQPPLRKDNYFFIRIDSRNSHTVKEVQKREEIQLKALLSNANRIFVAGKTLTQGTQSIELLLRDNWRTIATENNIGYIRVIPNH